jgi:hypothetical protein
MRQVVDENFHMKRSLVLALAFFLTACSAASTAPTMFPQMLGVEGVTVIGTGKTISDHVVSFTSGKNCSTVRKNTGRHYCEEDEVTTPEEVYCYNTLGNVSCYAQPAPHGEPSDFLGHVKSGAPPAR